MFRVCVLFLVIFDRDGCGESIVFLLILKMLVVWVVVDCLIYSGCMLSECCKFVRYVGDLIVFSFVCVCVKCFFRLNCVIVDL